MSQKRHCNLLAIYQENLLDFFSKKRKLPNSTHPETNSLRTGLNMKVPLGGLCLFSGANLLLVSGRVIKLHSGHIFRVLRVLLMGKNPAPVDMVNIPLFIGFYTSQVVQDFFHQQHVAA